ncbi:MAG: YHS domain-containing (seleno)protein [Panacagrimonas sp.]
MRLKKILVVATSVLVLALIGGGLFLRSLGMFSSSEVYATDQGAIDGYDPVAYFTDGTPTPGSPDITHEWKGASWRFAKLEHRDAFAAQSEKYAPQFGGYCAFAVSENYTARTDPKAWAIVDDQLFLNFDEKVGAEWKASSAARIETARQNWPTVLVGR